MTDSEKHTALARFTRFTIRDSFVASAYARLGELSRSHMLETVAFWLAVCLPAVYLPMLATGIEGVDSTIRFGGLLALHAVCLVVGHSHRA